MTLFDVIALGVLGISAFIGYMRGATREIMTVLSLLLAALAAVFSLRFIGPLARRAIDPDWAATGVALLIAFVFFYIALRVAGAHLTERVRKAKTLGSVDRGLGIGLGVVRAVVLLGAFNLLLNLATPSERMPRWITHAMLFPLTNACADLLKVLAPGGKAVAGKVGPALEKAVREGGGEKSDSGHVRRDIDETTDDRAGRQP